MRLPPRLVPLCLLAALGSAVPARAASKAVIAAMGDPAPGGGLFAGPGFVGWPAAAGSGWIAFRGQTTGGSSETLNVAHMTQPVSRAQVAAIGQTAPGEGAFKNCAGKLRQFIGRPTVNARGDVAFLALVTADEPAFEESDPLAPTAAGIFLYRGNRLAPVACTGQAFAGGQLDLLAIVDPLADPTSGELPERSPALNDAGDVAFLAGLVDGDGIPSGGAIVFAPVSGALTAVAELGAEFQSFGPPALNNHGTLAFHAATTDVDGIYLFAGGVLSLAVRDPIVAGTPACTDANGCRADVCDPVAHECALTGLVLFGDDVALNDRNDLAFLAGPIFDVFDIPDGEDTSPGLFVLSGGVITALGYPGGQLGPDRMSGLRLGSFGGDRVAPPSIAPDGSVVFFVSLDGGSGEAIVRFDGTTLLPLAYLRGTSASDTPAGGVYAGAESPPAVDAIGGVVFLARIAGGSTSEAVIYRPPDGGGRPIVIGDAAPGSDSAGFFAGRPFSAPLMNDRGDVVFRSWIARGTSSVGIFRSRAGKLEAIVRAGDPSPNPEAPPFLDLLGEPSLNQRGDIAFCALVPGYGRGIYVAEDAGLRVVATGDDPVPGEPGLRLASIAPNPSINDNGAIAFRATSVRLDIFTGLTERHEGVFLADGSGIHRLFYADDPSGLPFLKLRDPFLTNAPSVVFRASLGTGVAVTSGLFVADQNGTVQLVGEHDTVAGTTVTGFTADPAVGPTGELAFLASRSGPIRPESPLLTPLGPAILKRGPAGLSVVVARNMPGPAAGLFRAVSPPAINPNGHIAFRGSFQPDTGGTAGIFLAREDGLAPYVLVRENTSIGGRFSSFGTRPALNAADEIAFSASVVQGRSRNAIFAASPTEFHAERLRLRLRGQRARLALRLSLNLGRLSDGVRPAREPVTLTLGDTRGPLWSVTLPKGALDRRGAAFVATPRRKGALGALLRGLRLRVSGTRIRASATSATLELTDGGLRPLRPPFTVGLEVGDDSGRAMVPCEVGERGARCGG